MNELSVCELTKQYPKKTALSGVSFTLAPGIFGLLGPNGAGKTTLMHLISGILAPTGGTVQWNGCDIRTLEREYRKILGFQPQEPALYPNFTPREFLAYIAAVKGMKLDRKQLNTRIEELLGAVNLLSEADRKIREFSGGMKQRVSIAQALIAEPELLLLDEPTAGLDPKERIQLKNYITENAGGRIVIWSTHIVSDIDHIAQEILILRNGKLADFAAPEVLKEKLKDKVFLLEVPLPQIQEMEARFRVGNIYRKEDTAELRLITELPPEGARSVAPTLEDVSLYYFQDEQAEAAPWES
ncbi:MAG: ATP-binding cassette domain-containing protein [Lachnospiraceae bacterium]|nr:ATP-binding cassette domain-containing protein [Lachnospiraceae bacterium]